MALPNTSMPPSTAGTPASTNCWPQAVEPSAENSVLQTSSSIGRPSTPPSSLVDELDAGLRRAWLSSGYEPAGGVLLVDHARARSARRWPRSARRARGRRWWTRPGAVEQVAVQSTASRGGRGRRRGVGLGFAATGGDQTASTSTPIDLLEPTALPLVVAGCSARTSSGSGTLVDGEHRSGARRPLGPPQSRRRSISSSTSASSELAATGRSPSCSTEATPWTRPRATARDEQGSSVASSPAGDRVLDGLDGGAERLGGARELGALGQVGEHAGAELGREQEHDPEQLGVVAGVRRRRPGRGPGSARAAARSATASKRATSSSNSPSARAGEQVALVRRRGRRGPAR